MHIQGSCLKFQNYFTVVPEYDFNVKHSKPMIESSILLKEPFALKNSETVYLTIIFSTLSYSDIALIDNFDLIFFYFYFVFEIFGNNSVSIP